MLGKIMAKNSHLSWNFDLFLTFFIDCDLIYVPNRMIWGSTSRPNIGDHTVPHVTLLVSSGKFTSGLDFSGGALFFLQWGACLLSGGRFFTQGGTFWAFKKAQQNSGGL